MEKSQDHKRPPKRRPRRVETGEDLLKHVEEMERQLLPGFNHFADHVFKPGNLLSDQSWPGMYTGMNEVLHPYGKVKGWLGGEDAPYTYGAHTTRSSSSQRFLGQILTSDGCIENENFVKISKDIECPYPTDLVFDDPMLVHDIDTKISKSNARRKKRMQGKLDEEEDDVVHRLKDLSVSKAPRRQRAGSAGIRDASEYKQSRGVRKR
ncbi:hypothetical protein TWF281_001384 [Arthrobotrys megalospora]